MSSPLTRWFIWGSTAASSGSPGKGSGLSEECFSEVALGDVPNLYPFIVNDPGEGSQAKRRAHAVVVDHLTPAMTQADSYGELERLEDLIDQYRKVELTSPNRARQVANQIVEFVEETEVDADIAGPAMGEQVETFINRLEAYLYDLSSAQIRSGLHVLGSPPEGKALVDLLIALAKPRHEARRPARRRDPIFWVGPCQPAGATRLGQSQKWIWVHKRKWIGKFTRTPVC